jgi:hypothetical protein
VQSPWFRPLVCCGSLFVWLLLASHRSAAQSISQGSVSLDDALLQLVERIALIPNLHGPYRLEIFQNFAPESAKDTQESLRKQLEARHLIVVEDAATPVLHIGISQTPTQIILSASARVGERDEVRLLTFARANFRSSSLPVAPVRLEKQLVYQTPERLLDASSLWNGVPAGMALLVDRDGEMNVVRTDSAGVVQQTIVLAAAGADLSRDPRGELALQADAGSVLLPGKACQFAWAAPGDSKCHSSKSIPRAKTVLTPSCDPGGWKLEVDGSDWTTPDMLQAVPENAVQKGSAAILSDFPGPIVSINGEPNPSSALVVTRNLRTGNYEVYKITLACGN